MHGDAYPGMWIGTIVLVMALAGLVTVLTLRVIGRGPRQRLAPAHRPPPTHRAQEMLAERYARGEIDADEYRRRRELLRGNGTL